MCCSYAEYQKSDWFIFAFLESNLREVSIFQGSDQFGCAHLYGCVIVDDRKGLVLVSAIPLFEVFFTILRTFFEIIRSTHDGEEDYYDRLDSVLSKVNRRGVCHRILKAFQTCGVVFQPDYKMYEPDEGVLKRLAQFEVERHSAEEKMMMHWISEWALRKLLQNRRTHSLFGEKLALLIANVLLDQRIVLIGPKNVGSALALALISLVWPFRWLHMFLPVAAQSIESCPLFEAPVPFLVATTHIPDAWIAEPSDQNVLCLNFDDDDDDVHCKPSTTPLLMETMQDELVPQLPGHDEFSHELESAVMDIKLLETSDELSDEQLTLAVNKIRTACQAKIDLVGSALTSLSLSNNNEILSNRRRFSIQDTFLSVMIDTQIALDYIEAATIVTSPSKKGLSQALLSPVATQPTQQKPFCQNLRNNCEIQ